MSVEHHDVVIIGAGFAGIGLTIQMREAGLPDPLILERADGVGGTWRDNTYPGCACDVPSHIYSLSFAPNPDWSRTFSDQPEILEYIEKISTDHDIERSVRFNTELTGADWDEDSQCWQLETSTGPLTAGVVISCTGPFGKPVVPDVPGLKKFKGKSFHSIEWDHDYDLAGKRVAVIGTGPSAIQFVPKIQPDVEHMVVFQRTPAWILPRMNRSFTGVERQIFRRVPLARRATRLTNYLFVETLGLATFVDERFARGIELLGRWQLKRQVADPVLRAKLTPTYRIGCKRAIVSDRWFPALCEENVDLVTDGVAEVKAGSVVTTAGDEFEVDTLIYGTGFEVPPRGADLIRGRDGRSFIEHYDERPQSYLGTTLNGFPNFFMLLGPFAGAGNESALFTLESQMTYVVGALETMRERGVTTVEVRRDAQEEFVEEMERRSENTAWVAGTCKSYYQTADGKNAGIWPSWSFEFRDRTKHFDPEAYDLTAAAEREPAAA